MNGFDLADTYLYKLHLLAHNLDKVMDQTLTEHTGITLSQFLPLLSISQKEPANQREIARFLMLSPAAVCRQVEALVKKGWIRTHTSPKDRRDTHLTCTPAGFKVILSGHDVLHQQVFSVFNGRDDSMGFMQHIDALLGDIEQRSRQGRSKDNQLKKEDSPHGQKQTA